MFVTRQTPRCLTLGLRKIFFLTSLRKELEAKGLDLERNMNSVLLAFKEIFLAFSHAGRVLGSALTFEQRDLMLFAKCSRWVLPAKWKVSENLIATCRSLMCVALPLLLDQMDFHFFIYKRCYLFRN